MNLEQAINNHQERRAICNAYQGEDEAYFIQLVDKEGEALAEVVAAPCGNETGFMRKLQYLADYDAARRCNQEPNIFEMGGALHISIVRWFKGDASSLSNLDTLAIRDLATSPADSSPADDLAEKSAIASNFGAECDRLQKLEADARAKSEETHAIFNAMRERLAALCPELPADAIAGQELEAIAGLTGSDDAIGQADAARSHLSLIYERFLSQPVRSYGDALFAAKATKRICEAGLWDTDGEVKCLRRFLNWLVEGEAVNCP